MIPINSMKRFKLTTILICILIQHPAIASWCDGSQYMLFDMPLSKRLTQASEAVQQASTDLTLQSTQLKLDYETQNTQSLQQLHRQITQLSNQTVALCEVSHDAEFPLNTQSVLFNNSAELEARLRLNLGLLTAQQEAEKTIVKRQEQLQALASTLQKRKNTLTVLHNEWNLQQTIMQPVSAQQFIQSACLAVTESDDLLDQVQSITHNELVANKIYSQRNTPISEEKFILFLENCELDPSEKGLINQLMNTLKGWF